MSNKQQSLRLVKEPVSIDANIPETNIEDRRRFFAVSLAAVGGLALLNIKAAEAAGLPIPKGSGIINILDYINTQDSSGKMEGYIHSGNLGAQGTSVTTWIQECIQVGANTQRPIYLPPGKYAITQTLTIWNNANFYGLSSSATILCGMGNFDILALVGGTRMSVHDLGFSDPMGRQTNTGAITFASKPSNLIWLENLHFHNTWFGIHTPVPNNLVMVGNTIMNVSSETRGPALVLSNYSGTMWIEHFTSSHLGVPGPLDGSPDISLDGSGKIGGGLSFIRCVSRHPLGVGVQVSNYQGLVMNPMGVDTTDAHNMKPAMILENVVDVRLTGCAVGDTGTDSLQIVGNSNDVRIYNSSFGGAGLGGSGGAGLRIVPNSSGSPSNISLDGCCFWHNNGMGVIVSGNSNQLTFNNCQFIKNAGYGIQILGDHTGVPSSINIIGCMLAQNGWDGINLTNNSSGVLGSVMISSCRSTANHGCGIAGSGSLTNLLISVNDCLGNGKSGISLGSPQGENVIVNNLG